MSRKNPLNPTLGDLIIEQARLLAVMKNTYPGKVTNHLMTSVCAQHRIACTETILRLLKKAKKDPQTNLLAEIERAYAVPAAKLMVIDDPDFYTTGE